MLILSMKISKTLMTTSWNLKKQTLKRLRTDSKTLSTRRVTKLLPRVRLMLFPRAFLCKIWTLLLLKILAMTVLTLTFHMLKWFKLEEIKRSLRILTNLRFHQDRTNPLLRTLLLMELQDTLSLHSRKRPLTMETLSISKAKLLLVPFTLEVT